MASIIESKLNHYEETLQEPRHKQLFNEIYEACLFLLVSLTQIPSKGCYNCDSRKLAVKHLIGESVFLSFLNLPESSYLTYLTHYFGSGSIEVKMEREPERRKDLEELFRQSEHQKRASDKSILTQLFNNFSSSVLEIVLEKQEVGKVRYKCVVGDWIGGNIEDVYKPLETIDCEKIMSGMFNSLDKVKEVAAPVYKLDKNRPNINSNELIRLYTSSFAYI